MLKDLPWEEVGAKLLQPTLQNALRTEFYQSIWKNIDVSEIRRDSLHKLPVVSKEQIRQAGLCAQVREGLVCTEVLTMGTTGPPLITVRGDREQRFIKHHFSEIPAKHSGKKRTRALVINNPYHGSHISLPTNLHTHRIGVYDKGSFDHARHVLVTRHDDFGVEPYCTLLIGLERCLRAFTVDTRSHCPDRLTTYLEHIVSYGEYVTSRWRELFEDTWGCHVVDKYSLSEIFGGATQSFCGWYHFDPFVIPEVLSSQTGLPVTEGKGVLVLTALYPFQEAQPLVRYSTGDLVMATKTKSSRPGCLGIRPLGRALYGVLANSGKWLLTPAEILEAVDTIPEIQRIPLFRDSPQVSDPFSIGYPKYNVCSLNQPNCQRILIKIEVAKRVSNTRKADIGRYMVQDLTSKNPFLASHLKSGAANLEILFDRNFEADIISYSA